MSANALAFEVTADSTGFDAAFKRMEKTAAGFAASLGNTFKGAVASVASAAALKAFYQATIQNIAAIKDFSEQTELSTDNVQRLQVAAGKVGADFTTMQTGLVKLGAARSGATTNDQKTLDFFNKWGISLATLNDDSVTNLQLMEQIAEAVKGIELTPSQRDEFREVFGKGFEKTLAAMRELKGLGDIKLISKQDIEDVDRAIKQLEELKRTMIALGAPALGGFAQSINEVAGSNNAELPFETIARKLSNGETPGMTDILRLLGEHASPFSGLTMTGGTKGLREIMTGLTAGDPDGSALPFPDGKGKKRRDLVPEEQMRRMYDFLDKEVELTERIRKINFDMLSPKEQQLDLQERINDKLTEADQLKASGKDREAQSKLLEAAALNEQLQTTSQEDKPATFKTRETPIDSAAAAGAFIGRAVNYTPPASLRDGNERELLNVTQQVRDNTGRIAQKIETLTIPVPGSDTYSGG